MKIINALHIKPSLFLLLPLFLFTFFDISCVLTTSSKQDSNIYHRFRLTKAKFNFGQEEKFEFANPYFASDGKNRLIAQYEKKDRFDQKSLGKFFRVSEDAGLNFGEEYEFKEVIRSDEEFSIYGLYPTENGLAMIAQSGGNIYFSAPEDGLENWSIPVQINDEQDAHKSDFQILRPNKNDIYCVWTDKRRGAELIFFSASHDRGKNWSPNQAIDLDFREGMQEFPQIVSGANGRLLVFWQDWRDSKTLVDIRFSYSDNLGANWMPSRKINDDEEEIWQVYPNVVADGSNIYVAFSDFREQGEENDRDWNIYFARSTDNGATWEKNKRLNDIKEGRDEIPNLTIDREGNLFCIWRTTRETLFGQIAFSYSNDRGENWSPSVTLTKQDEKVSFFGNRISPFLPNKMLIYLIFDENGKSERFYSFLEKTTEPLFPNEDKSQKEEIIPLKFEIGEKLFADDFSREIAENWEAKEGFWRVEDETYMGVHPNNWTKPFVSFLKIPEPEQYVLKGRFKMDAVSHTAASFYFRSDERGLRQYVISNRFRHGAWLSVKDDELPLGFHISGGNVLVQKRFPFQNDRWYEFTLVVTPERIDYYVEGRLMLSYSEKLTLPKGKIGIGGFYASPTYFDDISISEMKR